MYITGHNKTDNQCLIRFNDGSTLLVLPQQGCFLGKCEVEQSAASFRLLNDQNDGKVFMFFAKNSIDLDFATYGDISYKHDPATAIVEIIKGRNSND